MHTVGVSRTYSREEADEILRRALEHRGEDGISHDDLLAAASEVGIPTSAVEAAASQLGEHQLVRQRMDLLRGQKRRAFARHLLTFLIANGGVFLFDRFDGGPWFFHYLLIVWGIVLMLLGIRQLAPSEAGLQRKAERELERERRRAERQRRRQGGHTPGAASQMPRAARELESAVRDGVSELMSAAARAIRDRSPGQKPRYRADEGSAEETSSSSSGDTSRRQHRL
ncbi:MAG: hypothetical protein RL685_3562 [Pseudomonadota bacterium]|jgi:uncharacterized membrane-anchored protein YhcB (DUF1043 family)